MPRPRKNPGLQSTVEHRGYRIAVKQDFGPEPPTVDGMPVMSGYVVLDQDGDNAMPGATWFQTVKSAKHAIDVLIDVGGPENADQFWALLRQEAACRHLRYVRGPEIKTSHGVFATHICTQCGDWRTETNALSSWMPSATLAVEASLPMSRDGRHEVELTAPGRTH